MSLVLRILVFIPIMFLVMVVYVAPQATDAKGVIEKAVPKTVKAMVWTVVIVVVMALLQMLFLP